MNRPQSVFNTVIIVLCYLTATEAATTENTTSGNILMEFAYIEYYILLKNLSIKIWYISPYCCSMWNEQTTVSV